MLRAAGRGFELCGGDLMTLVTADTSFAHQLLHNIVWAHGIPLVRIVVLPCSCFRVTVAAAPRARVTMALARYDSGLPTVAKMDEQHFERRLHGQHGELPRSGRHEHPRTTKVRRRCTEVAGVKPRAIPARKSGECRAS